MPNFESFFYCYCYRYDHIALQWNKSNKNYVMTPWNFTIWITSSSLNSEQIKLWSLKRSQITCVYISHRRHKNWSISIVNWTMYGYISLHERKIMPCMSAYTLLWSYLWRFVHTSWNSTNFWLLFFSFSNAMCWLFSWRIPQPKECARVWVCTWLSKTNFHIGSKCTSIAKVCCTFVIFHLQHAEQ